MSIVPLDRQRHDRNALTCGHDGLDQYLRRYAGQAIRNGLARVYVAEGDEGEVLGYYTLSAASVRQQDLPPDQARALPRYPVLAVLIGRMATDADVAVKYRQRTEAEATTLVVDDKRLTALRAGVQGELDRRSQALTGRVGQLAERYATPVPALVDEVETSAVRVNVHLARRGFSWK